MRRTDCPTPNFSTVTGLAMMLREYTRGDVIQKAHARHTTSRDRLPRSRVRMPRGRSLRPARCSDQARRRNALGALRDALPGVVRSRRGRRPDHAVLGAVRAARCPRETDAGQPDDAEPGRILDRQPGSARVRVQAARRPEVPQRRSVHGRGREVQLPSRQGLEGPPRPGEGRRRREPVPRALPAPRALPRLHGLLRDDGDRRRLDRQALSDAETLGASRPAGNFIPRAFDFALPIEPLPHNPGRAKQLLAEAGYPNGFDAGELYQLPPYFSLGEAIIGNLQAVGIKLKMRPMERAAYFAALQSRKAKGLCVCSSALYGNAASRMSEIFPSEGAYAYGGYPDVDALYKQQARETDRKKREAMLHQIQQLMNERTRIAPIFEYIWPSGIGPRVENPALMMINPYPWSAPLEDVRLKKS